MLFTYFNQGIHFQFDILNQNIKYKNNITIKIMIHKN